MTDHKTFMANVNDELTMVANILRSKNKAYGDSALNPVRCFSKVSNIEGILIRIDDKLSRIRTQGIHDKSEDTILDLIGYLILLRLALRENNLGDSNANSK
jgi:C4-type Zn-finger protein